MILHLAHSEPIGTEFTDSKGRTMLALACLLYSLH